MKAARWSAAVLGECLMSLFDRDPDDVDALIDARVAAQRLGEFVNDVCEALKKR